jgi:hypothetical protein
MVEVPLLVGFDLDNQIFQQNLHRLPPHLQSSARTPDPTIALFHSSGDLVVFCHFE